MLSPVKATLTRNDWRKQQVQARPDFAEYVSLNWAAAPSEHWQALMARRAEIEAENLAKLIKIREAEHFAFQIPYVVEQLATATVKPSGKIAKPAIDSALNADWWAEAAKREKEARKRGELVD